MTLRRVLRREERNIENGSLSGRAVSLRVRARWLLTLECGHQADVADNRGRTVQRIRCRACAEGKPADIEPAAIIPGVVRAPPSGLQRLMDALHDARGPGSTPGGGAQSATEPIGDTMATKKTVKKKTKTSGQPYVICRGYRSGVHAGYLVARDDQGMIVLRNARRIWSWSGAASLSELAVYGAKNRAQCRFGVAISRQELQREDVAEIIHCQPDGQRMIEEQAPWRA